MPASPEALQAVNAMLERQAGQTARMDLAQRRRLYPILVESRRKLLDDLTALPIEKFGAQHYRVALARVQAGIAALEQDFADGLKLSADPAFALADKHLREQIATYSDRFEGTVRPTSWEPATAVDDEVLLTRYKASVNTYGSALIQRVQQELALGVATETPWAELARKIAGQNGILAQDYFDLNSKESHRQSRAERIVRTELAFAYNRAHQASLARANEEDPGYEKTLWATFDPRTGDDSRSVHKQVRELDKPFEDNHGRVYMHPPNRPNDREVEIPTRAEWRDGGLPAGEPPGPKKPPTVAGGSGKDSEQFRNRFGPLSEEQRTAISQRSADWAANLPEPAKKAFEWWSNGGHRAIAKIRKKSRLSQEDRAVIGMINRAIAASAKAPIVEGTIVRGLKTKNIVDSKGKPVALVAGTAWEATTPTAFSLRAKTAAGFAKTESEVGMLLVVESKRARAVAKAMASKYHHQEEVWYPTSQKFRIVRVEQALLNTRQGKREPATVVYAEEID